jgi:hypothetical protein
MASKDHVTELTNGEWHDQGACLLRHEKNQKDHCKYKKLGRLHAEKARKDYYQRAEFKLPASLAKVSALSSSSKSLTRKGKQTAAPRPLTRDTTPTKPSGSSEPDFWDIDERADGRKLNFKASGPGHYPYRHQWHHLIPSEMLYQYLLTGADGARIVPLHLALMRGKYTIHHGPNVVLLPEEEQVGALVQFPTHLGRHPEYDKFAKSRLTDQKQQLQKALKDAGGKPHEVDAKASTGIGESLHRVSNDLFSMVEAFGKLSPGRELNAINQFAQRVEETLAKGKSA